MRRRLLALHFGVEPARIRDVRDQPVEPADIVLDHCQQPVTQFLRLHERQRFHRRTQGGEWILQLVRDVSGKAFDCLDATVERVGHVADRARQVADLVGAGREIRNFDARTRATPHMFGGRSKSAHRAADSSREQEREHDHHRRGNAEYAQDDKSLCLHRVIDLAALRGQQERAMDCAETLHRHGHGDDDLAAVVRAHHARLQSVERAADLFVAAAVAGTEVPVERKLASRDALVDRIPLALEKSGLRSLRCWQVESQNVAAPVERARVEQQPPVAIVDAGARIRWSYEPAEQRRNALWIDRKIERRENFLVGSVALALSQFEQAIWIDRDRMRVGSSRRRNRTGDDLALDQQTLDPRIDETSAVFRKIKNSRNQCDQAGKIEQNDAAADAGEAAVRCLLPPSFERAKGSREDIRTRRHNDGLGFRLRRGLRRTIERLRPCDNLRQVLV